MRIVLAHGAFDLLHAGHIEHLRAARANADRLIVSVSGDEVIRRNKGGNRPIEPVSDRVKKLRSLRFVDQVWVCTSDDASDAILLFSPDVFVKGRDWIGTGPTQNERTACRRVGCSVAYTQTDKKSTTDLINRCKLS